MTPWLHFWQSCIKYASGCVCDWNKQDCGFVLVLLASLTPARSIQQHSLEHPKLFSSFHPRGFSNPGVVRGEDAMNPQGNLPSGRSVHSEIPALLVFLVGWVFFLLPFRKTHAQRNPSTFGIWGVSFCFPPSQAFEERRPVLLELQELPGCGQGSAPPRQGQPPGPCPVLQGELHIPPWRS